MVNWWTQRTELGLVLCAIDEDRVRVCGETIASALREGKKVLVAGNGGSASDAQHFVGELVCTFQSKKRRALPAVCLNTNASVLTAWANDFSYDGVFERQVDALGENKDVFLAITTSGNSQNIIRAMQKAKERGMIVILLTGKGGGLAYKLAHYAVKVPSSNTPRIQEAHALILHTICQIVDDVHGK